MNGSVFLIKNTLILQVIEKYYTVYPNTMSAVINIKLTRKDFIFLRILPHKQVFMKIVCW